MKGFTLVELAVVVIITAIIAGFILPSFAKSLAKSEARQTGHNLMAIAAANEIYKARRVGYWPAASVSGITAINGNLELSLSAISGVNYTCTTTTPGQDYNCTAQKSGTFGFTRTVTQASPTPSCGSFPASNPTRNNPC